MIKDSLGNRMKENYENRSKTYLLRRTPVIVRLDGNCFHNYTRKLTKPFSEELNNIMSLTMKSLCEDTMGSVLGYTQSDEISILLLDYKQLTTQAYFDYNVQKICSLMASRATAIFNVFKLVENKFAYFDCRAFNVPREEILNYFIWRQKDWNRNSIQMLSQSVFSHKQLHKKNTSDMHEMLHQKDINWAKLEPKWKNGTFYVNKEDALNHKDIISNRNYFNEIINIEVEE